MSKRILYLFVLLANLQFVLAQQDFYQLLGLERNAETADIKRAFRKKSLEFHPDKNPGDEDAADKFTKINRAYEVLSDDHKRQLYDQYGEEEVEIHERGGDNRRKGPSNKVQIPIKLEDLYKGAEMQYSITRNVYCHECKGSGAEGGKQKVCPTCKGAGQTKQKVNMGFMQMEMNQPCQKCAGRGKINEKNCQHCRGKKVVQEPKTFFVNIERGMKNGETIRFERQGEQVPDMLQGDIIFTLQQQTHSVFKRVNNNLYMNMDITLQEALMGFERTFYHLDGHQVTLKSEPKETIQPFSWKIIKDEGMPIRGTDDYGELHVKLIVGFPKSLTPKQKELVELIFPE